MISITTATRGGKPVDLPDPHIHPDELKPDGTPAYAKKRIIAPLYEGNGPELDDVAQGFLDNCSYPASIGAIFSLPGGADTLKKMVRPNADGTFTVSLFQRNDKMQHVPVQVKVDTDFYVHPDGSLLYGKNGPANRTKLLLFPLLEKAYARLNGGYGGVASENAAHAFQTLLGKDATFDNIRSRGEKRVWETVTSVIADKRPIVAGTSGTGKDIAVTDFAGKAMTVYSEHQYSIMGTGEVNGRKYIELRNPWGKTDRSDNSATNGIFRLDLTTFKKVMVSLAYIDAPRVPVKK